MFFYFALYPLGAIAAPVLQNITITAPKGTSDHGDPHILCTPIRQIDIASFFLANYVAHAATVKALPGQPIVPAFLDLLFALFFPVSGVIRGLKAIYRAATFREIFLRKTPLETAVRAGAVCEVVRTKFWRPNDGDIVRDMKIVTPIDVPLDAKLSSSQDKFKRQPPTNVSPFELSIHSTSLAELSQPPQRRPTNEAAAVATIKSDDHILIHEIPQFSPANEWSLTGRKVHGICELPPGYALATVPMYTEVEPLPANPAYRKGPGGEDDVSFWRYLVGGSLNVLFSTHAYLRKLKNLKRLEPGRGTRSAKESSAAGIEKLDRQLKFYTNLERKFPPPKLPGEYGASTTSISSHYSFAKGIIAVLQLFYASYTITETKGDQISRYGYAAFGLTVAPYIIMSFINLVSFLLTADYSHVYLVSTDVMKEAEDRHGGRFDGIIG